MDFKEFSAKTVDQAITNACLELETSSENLEIEVLEHGSSGFLGFGSKPARIRVRRKPEQDPFMEEAAEKKPEVKKEKPTEKPVKEVKKEAKTEPKPEKKSEPKVEKAEVKAAEEPKAVQRSQEEVEDITDEAKKFLDGVFHAMNLEVVIKMEYHQEEGNLDIDFSGDDMGILIGKRGQTLDSLQYLTSLVVNKGKQGYIRVKLDTENYRSRRKETLENLAKSIAYKVRKTRKAVSLEPMNPYERRIIHSALQGNRYVETYSEGNEPYRHVVVKLKK